MSDTPISDSTPQIIICAILAVLLLCSVSFLAGMNHGIKITEQKAIRAGVAEWAAEVNGKPMFQWKESK